VGSEGVEIEISALIPVEVNLGGHRRVAPLDADVLVFQRPAKASAVALIPEYQAKGKAVVVDVDDDLHSLHPRHGAYQHFHPAHSSEVNWDHLKRACDMADLVTCTTPALAERYGAHGRVEILPNCVPASMLSQPRESDGRTLGWFGGIVVSHVNDLSAPGGAVAEVLRSEGWRFMSSCDGPNVRKALGLDEDPIDLDGPSPAEFECAMSQLDVGIVPLALTPFNDAKSTLKGLQYAAAGVPFVASATAPYQQLADWGLGDIATNRVRSWRSALLRLMRDPGLREHVSASGRAWVAANATYEVTGHLWRAAWERALTIKRARG
jgi:glycosyltransferase involved in cell wall biosynthesis